jgi:hypothetical protein
MPLLQKIEQSLDTFGYIKLSDEEWNTLDADQILEILNTYGGKRMMLLLEAEIAFFEWLKQNDEPVWNDLWLADDDTQPYLVSVDLLPVVLNKDGRGFPICDLQTTDNYFFSIKNMVDEESKLMIEAAKELFQKRRPMTAAQLLALEISLDPIDIWHFAYKHHIALSEAKQAVASLVEDNALVHLKEAEYVTPFIHF